MKYNIPIIRNLIVCAAVTLVTACSDDAIDDSTPLEFGTSAKMFTVSSNAGHVDLQLLSNQNCLLEFEEETPWAEISVKNINGDGKFYIDYDSNPEFPRMTKVIVRAQGTALADTITLRQYGLINPTLNLESGTLIIKGSSSGSSEAGMDTNLEFDEEVTSDITYTGGEGTDWIKGVGETNGKLNITFDANASQNPRSATLNLSFDNGWGELQTTTLYVTQMSRNDELGTKATFQQIMNMAVMSADVTIDDYYIISGYVVSDKNSGNAGDNIQTTPTSIDYSISNRTIYLESEDGKLGFNILTETAEDNVFDRYDHVELLVKGAILRGENDPYRYSLSGINTTMIVGRTAGTASDIPVKEKYISELNDDDIYTFVTLKDCEFPIRKGSLAPIHDGYTLADNCHRLTKYPRLMRDIQGSSIYLYTNTTCPYRRDGKKLPYGSGKISGVVVFEYFKPYVYGDGYDEDTHGRIGTYQLRHQSYSDIKFDDTQTFSALLTEYRYIKDKAKDTDGFTYWYPTYGNNGRFTHTSPRYAGCYGCTTWNYLGWTGTAKGIAPFKSHLGNADNYGVGIILEDGTDYKPSATSYNSDGKGQEVNTVGTAWNNLDWWEPSEEEDGEDIANSWLVEVSTAGISTDNISMQMTVQGGRALELTCPIFWKAEWSTEKDLTDDSKWNLIGEYQVPDFPLFNNYHGWQLPGFKQIDFPLPLEILGHEHVYIRMTPTSKRCNTSFGWNAGEVTNPYTSTGSAMDYFAIRYNK